MQPLHRMTRLVVRVATVILEVPLVVETATGWMAALAVAVALWT